MSPETLKLLEYVIAASVFGLVFALWLAGVLVLTIRRRSQTEKIEKRLGIGGGEAVVERELSLWLDDRAVTTKVPGLGRTNVFQRFEQLCQDAGWQTPAGVVLLAVGGVTFFVIFNANGREPQTV